jgi:uncharacterized membrane protein
MSSFAWYLIGFIVLVICLAWAAILLNVPTLWVGIGVVVLLGMGIMMATRREKSRDLPKV